MSNLAFPRTRSRLTVAILAHEASVDLDQTLASVRSLADPTPPAWSQLWFGTHPTLLERVALARRP